MLYMGNVIINTNAFSQSAGPRRRPPPSYDFLGTILNIGTHGKRDFLITVGTTQGRKKILLGEALLPSDSNGLKIGQKRWFTCHANIANSCSIAGLRASKKPSNPVENSLKNKSGLN